MSVAALLSTLAIHPQRITRDALAVCDAHALAAAAEHEQVVPRALRGLQSAAPGIRDAAAPHIAALRESARRWTLYEALQRRAVADVLDRAGAVDLVFFKGASLAYGAYGDPADRMRLDWDVLARDADVNALEQALGDAGFVKDVKKPGRIRVRQRSYRRPLADGECTIDLHTGIVNAPAIARRITFDQVRSRAVPLPGLHAAARGLDDVDALILGAVHRLVHHPGEWRLIWDVDIVQLLPRVTASMPELASRAAAWDVGPLVAHEMRGMSERRDYRLPTHVEDALGTLAAQPSGVTMFTRDDRSRGHDFALDWRALGWRDRAALVQETFLPDPAFVRAASGSRLPLPLLYLRRLAAGALGWFRRPALHESPDHHRPDRPA